MTTRHVEDDLDMGERFESSERLGIETVGIEADRALDLSPVIVLAPDEREITRPIALTTYSLT